MRWGLPAGALGLVAAIAAVVVATSSAGGGGSGPYVFHSGVFVADNGSLARVYLQNGSSKLQRVKVKFVGIGDTVKQTVELDPGEVDDASGMNLCQPAGCPAYAEARAKTPLILPTLRYQDTAEGVGEWGPGVWTVTRGGKRVF